MRVQHVYVRHPMLILGRIALPWVGGEVSHKRTVVVGRMVVALRPSGDSTAAIDGKAARPVNTVSFVVLLG